MLFTFSGSEAQATTTYYSTGSADVNTLAHWTDVRDGSGASPADFASGDAFVCFLRHFSLFPCWSSNN